MDSREENIPNLELSCTQSTTALHPLDIEDILESILLNVKKSGVRMLLPLRLVSHKWNDAIVKILEETHQKSFTKYFRMRHTPEDHLHELEGLALEDLDDAIMTFSSTATSLEFPRVQFDYFYFMTDCLFHRLNFFTEVQGPLIKHLTFDARNDGTDFLWNGDGEIVVLKCLGAIFKGTPNLQTLNFKMSRLLLGTRIFAEREELPKLENLNKIEIYEVDAQRHNEQFLQDHFGMAPNLSELSIVFFESVYPENKTLNHYMNLFKTFGAPEVQIFPNLVKLQLSLAPIVSELSAFGFLNLTTLVITSVQEHKGNSPALNALLECLKTTLVTLKLGDTSDCSTECRKWVSRNGGGFSGLVFDNFTVQFPTVMTHLKTFEVNLVIFPISTGIEEIQFPILENLRIIIPKPNQYDNDTHRYSREFKLSRQCGQIVKGSPVSTVKKFAVFCRDDVKIGIIRKFPSVQAKFLNSEIYFGIPYW